VGCLRCACVRLLHPTASRSWWRSCDREGDIPVPGSGRYVSSDGTRVVRMGDSDIIGAHGGGPHMSFEELRPNPARPGRMMVINNSHVYLIDP
jgi:hypothetical protein